LEAGKKITKTIDFLSLQPSLRSNAHKIPQLMNPYEFITLANNQVLLSTPDVSLLTLANLGIQEGDIQMTPEQKEYLKQIASDTAIKNDPQTINAMIASFKTASVFLETRKDLAGGAIELIDKANGVLEPFQKLL
jgi:hypothetical protein